MDEEIAALLESSLPAGRRDRKQAEKLQSGVNKLFGAPAGTGIDLGFKSTYDIPIPDQKIDTTPPNPLDKEAVEEYLAGMFGEAKKPDPNPEQPVENDSTITPRKEG